MSSAKPNHQRPELPDFWDHRFRSGVTPWEAGEAPSALRDFADRYASPAPPKRQAEPGGGASQPQILIPGCGSACDAAFLAQRGWEVTALDFSGAAVERARWTLGDSWRGKLLCADFFTFTPEARFDLIYERAFLCALPRKLWPDYAARIAGLLHPGGLLVGFFLFGSEVPGPPFAILPEQLDDLLAASFVRRDDRPVTDSLPVFAGRERWQEWQRR